MKITNEQGLPEPIVRAVKNDGYSKGDADYSATELLAPYQQTQLKRRHWDELVEDASERIWSLLGQAVHAILQRAEVDSHLQEERLSIKTAGRKISGQVDCYAAGTITDYKVTSVWSRIFGDRIGEWEAQVNIYAELYEQAGYPVDKVEVLTIYRDWSAREAKKDPERYPQTPAEVIKLNLWPMEKRRDFILARVTGNVLAEAMKDANLPECTADEMWEKKTTYAVMKAGKQRAERVFDRKEQADNLAMTNKALSVVVRPGERTRCESYCSVRDICPQFKKYNAGKAVD